MTGMRQAWLVARREMRERARSRGFRASVVFLVTGVAAMLILPVLLRPGSARDVGITGPVPAALTVTITQQAHTAAITARVRPYATVAAYPASHGCVRMTVPAMDRMWSSLWVGMPVAIYSS